MLLKNSPWAAGVHSLSAVRPWGQGGREGEMKRKTESEKETADGCKKKKCGKLGWSMSRMHKEKDGMGKKIIYRQIKKDNPAPTKERS